MMTAMAAGDPPRGEDQDVLRPYVPRLIVDWLRRSPDDQFREVDGSLAFVDISGFTKLTERLARKGRVGAEEMSDILSATFSALLAVAYEDGAGLVKWGGDAVLLLFEGPGHAARAARAAYRMRQTMREVGRIATASGLVTLRMSVGIHSGVFHFFLVGDPQLHRELLVSGPAASVTAQVEATASAGEIGLSSATAALLPPRVVRPGPDGIWLLSGEPSVPGDPATELPRTDGLDLGGLLSAPVRAHLLAGGGEPEHRRIAVAFVQFSGTDDLLAQAGPAELAEALDECVRNVQEAAHRHGVTFFETDINRDGGKIMLVAGAPVSGGENEERMLLATRLVLDRPGRLAMRIGVNCGPVFSGDFGPEFRRTYSVKGDAINLAARVMGKAGPGQLLATEDALARSRTLFEIEPLPPFMVKGKTQPVHAVSVGPPVGTARQSHELPLVGREEELAALRRALADAATGRGQVVDVVGEPGIGKSRLVSELLAGAPDIVRLTAACAQYESSTPYYPWRRLLRQIAGLPEHASADLVLRRLTDRVAPNAPELVAWLPLLGVPLDVDLPPSPQTAQLSEKFRKARLEEVVEDFLHATLATATVLLVEDAHLMDDASVDLLHKVAAQIATRPWLVLLTRLERPTGFVPATGQLSVRPAPLSPAGLRALVTAATEQSPLPPHRVDAIVARSGGNPMFLQGLLAAPSAGTGDEDLPESVEGLITSQIDRLPARERSLLRRAAVLGATFSEDHLRQLLSTDELPAGPASLRRLWEFLEPAGDGRFRFRHTLMRDVAYAGLAFRRRRDMHARVGQTLEASTAAPEELAEVLSLHYFYAGWYPQSWHYSRLAGRRSKEKYAYAEAAEFFRRAVECARRTQAISVTDLAEVYEGLGDAQMRVGEYDAARRAYRAARRDSATDDVHAADLLLKEAMVLMRQGRLTSTMHTLSRGLTRLEERTDPVALAGRSTLESNYAWCRSKQGRYREAWVWGHRAKDHAAAADDRAALAEAYGLLQQVATWANYPQEQPFGERALTLYTELGDTLQQANAENNLAGEAFFAGNWSHAVAMFELAGRDYERAGDRLGAAIATYNLADIALRQGRIADAEELLTDVKVVAAGLGEPELLAAVNRELGRAWALRGQVVDGRGLVESARASFADMGGAVEVLVADAALVECDLLDALHEQALIRVDDALRRARMHEAATVLPTLARLRAATLLGLGRAEEARSALVAALADEGDEGSFERGFILVTLADACARLRDPAANLWADEARAALLDLQASDAAVVLP